MNLEEQTSKINAIMRENARCINEGNTPDMSVLENEISQFLNSVKELKATRAKDYLDLVQIWSGEIKKMSDKLSQLKHQMQSEMSQVQAQGRAFNAYNKAGQ